MSLPTALSETAENLKPLLSKLAPTDRLALADFLYDSVDDEELSREQYQAEWEAELIRRIKETEAGTGGEISGDEMRRLARETLR